MDWHWWWWGKNSYFWHVRSPVRMNNILPSCMGHIFKTKVLLVTMTMTKIRWLTLLLLYWSRMDDTLPSCWGHVSIAHTVECYESPPGNFNFDQLHIENDGDNIIMLTTDGWIMIVSFYKKRGIPKTVFKKDTKKLKKIFQKLPKTVRPAGKLCVGSVLEMENCKIAKNIKERDHYHGCYQAGRIIAKLWTRWLEEGWGPSPESSSYHHHRLRHHQWTKWREGGWDRCSQLLPTRASEPPSPWMLLMSLFSSIFLNIYNSLCHFSSIFLNIYNSLCHFYICLFHQHKHCNAMHYCLHLFRSL